MTVKRPFLLICAFFIAGMYLIGTLGATVSLTVVFCAFLAGLIKAQKTKKIYENFLIALTFISLCLGIFLYGMSTDINSKDFYQYVDEEVRITGVALKDATESENYVSLELKADTIEKDGQSINTNEKIIITCFLNENVSLIVPQKNDIVSVKCKVSLPEKATNSGGFDYRNYLKSKNIFFCGTTEDMGLAVAGHKYNYFTDFIDKVRDNCSKFISKTLPFNEEGVLKAYIIGDSSSLSDEMKESFKNSGLSHVLAVSGMHVVVFISCLIAFLKIFIISKRKQVVIAALSVIFFVFLTGASTSVIRAGVMFLMGIMPPLIFKRMDSVTSLTFVAALLAVFNPSVIFEASFMLSFAATLGILIFSQSFSDKLSFVYSKLKEGTKIRRLLKSICDLIAVGLAAQIFIIPLQVYLFNEISSLSVIATVIVNPLLSPMLIGGLLFCLVSFISPLLAFPFAGFTYVFTKILILIAKFFANLPFSRIPVIDVTIFSLFIYALIVISIYFKFIENNHKAFRVFVCSACVLTMTFTISNFLYKDTIQVSFINVGQGDCSLIKTSENCDILIDAGGEDNDYSTGTKIVKPYLIKNGVYDIEYAIASHGHTDHINGIIGLIDEFKIEKIIVPYGFGLTDSAKELILKAEENDIEILYMKHGDVLKINDEMKLEAIMPDEKIITYTTQDDENDRSLLLKFTYGDTSFMFTGDLTSVGEAYAVSYYKEMLDADVLKIAHHGSKHSTTEEFLEAVSPKYAYIPVGKNMYGHPSDKTLKNLANEKVIYYRADTHNDLTFYLGNGIIKGIKFSSDDISGGYYDIR